MVTQNDINLSASGVVAYDGAGTFSGRTITGTANQITITNGSGTGGNPTAALTSTIQVGGISFDSGSNTLAAYSTGTWTPTLDGSTPGTTTYTAQTGYYTIIGNLIYIHARITFTALTGTGSLVVGGFPQTVKNQDTYQPVGHIEIFSTGFTYPTGTTDVVVNGIQNTTGGAIQCQGSTKSTTNLVAANTSGTIQYTMMYQF